MTLLVGILCKDGVVVASDSAATFGTGLQATIGQQEVQKVRKLNDHIIYCGTGAVGISQIISDRILALWASKAFSGTVTPEAAMHNIGTDIAQTVGPYLQTGQLQHALTGAASTSLCKSLIAMPVGHKPHLFQFDFNGAPERCTIDLPFVALGSGQVIADPFLAFLRRLLWTGREPTLSEGRLAAVWTIDHVSRTNPGGVGGEIQLATLEPGKTLPVVAIASRETVEEHRQKVVLAEQALIQELIGKSAISTLPLPVPPQSTNEETVRPMPAAG